jgi:hypothetical protein
MFKRNGWSRKKLCCILLHLSEELCQAYLDEMRHFVADDLVFLDKFIFNEKTGNIKIMLQSVARPDMKLILKEKEPGAYVQQ